MHNFTLISSGLNIWEDSFCVLMGLMPLILCGYYTLLESLTL